MPLHPKDFSEASTEANPLPPGYAKSCARHPLRIAWTDSHGAQSCTVTRRAVLGSAPNADVVVVDAAVSKLHAEVDPREDGTWIVDLSSRNGTFVAGILVRAASVPEGGSVRLGSTVLTMHREPVTTDVDLWPEDHFGRL